MKRFIIIVLDSLGAGELPDAAAYNSLGANTLGHVAAAGPGNFQISCLQSLGLANIIPLSTVAPVAAPLAAYGKMAELTAGMDTTCGHWEIAGLVLPQPLPTYPHGFPPEIITRLAQAFCRGILGNCVASGTEIIQRLGPEHLRSGQPIVYTSADSVLQIAAHEDIIPLELLYQFCRASREIMSGEHSVGRIIARPFVGNAQDGFVRVADDRRDFSLTPPKGGLLEKAVAAGVPVISVGKIYDIFASEHINKVYPGHSNSQSADSLRLALQENQTGLVFANFVDFDALYGHRNDTAGYHRALEEFDAYLAGLLPALLPDDILAICGDHGNDPALPTSDHTREYVPLLVYGSKVKSQNLGIRESFADLGQTAAAYLGIAPLDHGSSFLRQILLP